MATLVTAPVRPPQRVAALSTWHLLSLDAPSVAALWAWYLAWNFGVPVPADALVALALAVWTLYVLDRILDAQRGRGAEARHRFHIRNSARFLAGCAAAAMFLPLLVSQLPHALRTLWLSLAVPLALYIGLVHVLSLRRVPKEPLVAVFFAAAVAAPVTASHSVSCSAVLPGALCFGLLCWLNCTAIARWEHTLADADPVTAWLGSNFQRSAVCVAALAVPLLLLPSLRAVGSAVLAGAAALLLLEYVRARFEASTVRALADAALLTPLVTWPLAGWLHLR